ncbi:MAG: bifunctional homocysteine S-methyltransferase/methylenetetrahydrofolate reductase [Chitinivibrionales bacterium]|nr:bifunctional homocysteine S-methyltransferase/methylenetetrahydrofolate reductase [Chitinivibrionales bacterium]
MKTVIDRMEEKPLLFDGAMGTMLYQRGVFINTCYDELCLTKPGIVKSIHEEYVASGAEVLETNTFGANRIKLGGFGLSDSVGAINRAATACAREAGGDTIYVAGSIGPCTKATEALPDSKCGAVKDAFEEQISSLVEGGVDCILFETFSKENELRLAVEAAGGTSVPVIASFTVGTDATTAFGTPISAMASLLQQSPAVGALGLNCGTGPAEILEFLEKLLQHTDKPVLVMPNAGYPREVDGRLLYLTNPEYFTEYAKQFIKVGARGIGGCCGTTPQHISAMTKAVRNIDGVKTYAEIRKAEAPAPDIDCIPPEKKSRFAAKLLSGEKVSSVELVPPRSTDMSSMIEKSGACAQAGVDAINIPDGPRASLRISPMIAAMTIVREAGIEPVLHYCCRDRNLIGMQADILGGYAAGISNFLIITGDPPKMGSYPDATGVFDIDAIGLTQTVSNLNRGIDIGGSAVNPPTGIFIGVGANPCALDMEREIERFRLKIEAGAEFAITQPVFDIKALFSFLDKAESLPRTIPVIAGVWPLVSYRNAEFMNNEVPGVVVPEPVLTRMRACTKKEEGINEGIAICRELINQTKDRVNGFQVSAPFGKVEIALKVLEGFL